MESTRSKVVNRAPQAVAVAAPVVQRRTTGAARVQAKLRVSSPSDPAEHEAESTATRVMRMPAPEGTTGASLAAPSAQRATDEREKKKPEEEKQVRRRLLSPYLARYARRGVFGGTLQLKSEGAAAGAPDVGANVEAEIERSRGTGSPLPPTVRRFMEPRFRADFGGVRIHTNDRAATLSRQLGARAFTVGNQIFFGRGQYQPETSDGQELLAHELTHTIQQGSVVQRAADATVSVQSPRQAQRLGISDALDYFADKAYNIPGFRMFTILLGVNPINMSRVERSAANILRAVVEFLPGGHLIVEALDNYGIFDKIGKWVDDQLTALGITGGMIRKAIDDFLDSLSWRDIFHLGSVWERAKRIFTDPIDRIITFVKNLAIAILKFIKDAILRPLAGLAANTRGYDLIKAILGQDPITGDPYPRTADTLIGGFMKLIGQEEVWENIKKAHAIPRAWAWFQGALSGLMGFVRAVPQQFVATLMSLTITDIVVLPKAFAKVARFFIDTGVRFVGWALEQVLSLLQIIFEVLAPGAMVYLRKAQAAFKTIVKNPIGFIRNLVRAGIQGFRQFGTNFLTHLKNALIQWITGTMAGANIYLPQAFTIPEIIKFVLSVLGLTWQNLRAKIVKVIGEPAMKALETGFDIVVTLVREGPAAAWEKIVAAIGNLRDMVMDQVMAFVRDKIITAAITKLVTSLNPAGAFIQAVIAIYNTVMFFVERLKQIAQVAMAVIDAIAAIAAGVIVPAANKVEQTMAGLLTLVISFLARLVGLGNVSEAVSNVIAKVRAPVDVAMDKVVAWVVETAKKLGKLAVGAVKGAVAKVAAWWARTTGFKNAAGESHTLSLEQRGELPVLVIQSSPEILGDYIKKLPPAVRTSQPVADIQARIAQIEALKDPNGGFSASAGDKIAQHFAEIVKLLAQIADSQSPNPPPPTVVQWPASTNVSVQWPSPSSEPLSISMIADPLTINPGSNAGSPPGHAGKLWSSVNRREGAYKRGHLLSQQLFGPGSAKNLVPITGSLNTWMEANVESKVKGAVLSQKRMVRFEVHVQFGGHNNRTNLPDEAQLPTAMSFSLTEYKHDGKAWVLDPKQLLPGSATSKRHELPENTSLKPAEDRYKAWQARVGGAKPPIRQYDQRATYAIGEVLVHPTLGTGFVAKLGEGGKITVTFDAKAVGGPSAPVDTTDRVLVSGRK